MFKRWSSVIVALALCSVFAGRPARAQTGLEPLTTTTAPITALATTAGVVVLVIVLAGGDEEKEAPKEATKAAELYLRQNALQLAQDLNTGHGPFVEELATGLKIKSENREAFRKALRGHRAELLALADADQLSPDRAVQFARALVTALRSDVALRADLDARVRTALN